MLESLLTHYGYPILIVGTFLEGETIMVLGGLAAHLGYLALQWVIVCGFFGSLLGNQLFFFLGRRHGKRLLARNLSFQSKAEHIFSILERHQNLVIAGFPFLYGFRIVTPVAIGMSGVSYPRFAVLNVIGVGIWATAIASAGYFFGRAIEAVLGDARRYELALIAGIAVIGTLVWIWHRYKRHGSDRRSSAP